MQENPMVETTLQDVGPDDTALETAANPNAEGTTLDAVLDEQPESARRQEQPKGTEKQAGWIQKRIQEGVSKQLQAALAQERLRMAAEYDLKLRPLQEAALSRDADELVASGKITSKEMALEFLRLKRGVPAPQQEAEQTPLPLRNEKGQFTSQPTNTPDSTEQYGQMLIAQAKAIEVASGLNVMDAYNEDPEVKHRVLSREWDFSDVARYMVSGGQASTNPLPTPTRRPNGLGPSARSIHDLSTEQFGRIQKYLEQGGVIDMRQK